MGSTRVAMTIWLTLSTIWLTPSMLAALAARGRGDVAGARPHPVVRAGDVHAQAVELAVSRVRRRVAEHVLAVELLGDSRRRLVELRRVLDDLGPPAALGGDLAQRRRVDPRVDWPAFRPVDRDRIDEGVAAPQRRPHLAQRRRARGVGAVRDHQEG